MVRDAVTEEWLNQNGIEWEYLGGVDLAEVDEKRSLVNQARFEALNQQLVDDYAEAMKNGARFPAAIVWKDKSSYIYVSGNHRHFAAKKAGRHQTDAYLVKTVDRYVIDRLTRAANILHGARLSRQERMENGKYFVHHYKMTIANAAAVFGLDAKQLGDALRADEVRTMARRAGVEPGSLTGEALKVLHRIPNERPLVEAVRIVRDGRFTGAEAASLAADVASLRSETAQMEWIQTLEASPSYQLRKAQTARGRDRFGLRWAHLQRALNTLINMMEKYKTLDALEITDDIQYRELVQIHSKYMRLMNGILAPKAALFETQAQGTSGRRELASIV